ncbi:MAG: hypothetical protein ACJA2Q_002467 [Pseudohongiellaceae bacterium]|jgi:hypothetical protein
MSNVNKLYNYQNAKKPFSDNRDQLKTDGINADTDTPKIR